MRWVIGAADNSEATMQRGESHLPGCIIHHDETVGTPREKHFINGHLRAGVTAFRRPAGSETSYVHMHEYSRQPARDVSSWEAFVASLLCVYAQRCRVHAMCARCCLRHPPGVGLTFMTAHSMRTVGAARTRALHRRQDHARSGRAQSRHQPGTPRQEESYGVYNSAPVRMISSISSRPPPPDATQRCGTHPMLH
jgi:hypothetical protein